MNKKELNAHIVRLRSSLQTDKRELRNLPDGRLFQIVRGKNRFFMHAIHGKSFGITKNPQLVRQLMRKTFLIERIRRTETRWRFLKELSKTLEPIDTASILKGLMEKHPFLTAEGCLHNERTNQWMNADYEKNPSYPERCVHFTGNGIATRSKEEKEIGNILESKNIAYRYDWLQYIGNKRYAPDFTVLRESDGKIIFWEHFGLISSQSYRKDAYAKLLHYESCGLHLWDNFIITFPKTDGSLDTSGIEKVCELFLR